MEAIWDKLINLRIGRGEKSSLREKAFRGLGGFFVVMIVFTILSRAANAMTIPQVTTQAAEKKTIDRTIKASGTASQDQEEAVTLLSGLLVKKVNASQGSKVEEGDALMEISLEHLEEQIASLELEITKLELQADDSESKSLVDSSNKSKELQRAQEDYNKAVSRGNTEVTNAYEDMIDAYNAWQEALTGSGTSSGGTDSVEQALSDTYTEKQNVLAQAEAALKDLESECALAIEAAKEEAKSQSEEPLTADELGAIEKKVNEEYAARLLEAGSEIDSAQDQVSSAYDALSKYQEDAAAQAQASANDAADSLEDAYKQAKRTYDQAVSSMNDSVTSSERAIEDASAAEASDSSDEIAGMELDVKKSELEKLTKLKEQGGIIQSPISGTVTFVGVSTGDYTPDTKAFLVSDTSQGTKFTAQVTKEQQQYLSVGDSAILNLKDNTKIEDLEIQSVTQNKEDSDTWDVTLLVPGDKINIGESAELQVNIKSKTYSTCVPLTALHEENSRYYLLVIKETDTVLGTESSVESMEVSIKEKNDSYAALDDGVLAAGQEFVIESTKEIASGDKVRVVSE